jgi:hypothetical protein
MKKLIFAAQVFGIIAMFPLYVILEMNHGTSEFPAEGNRRVVTEESEKALIEPLNSESQVKMLYPVKYLRVQQYRTAE